MDKEQIEKLISDYGTLYEQASMSLLANPNIFNPAEEADSFDDNPDDSMYRFEEMVHHLADCFARSIIDRRHEAVMSFTKDLFEHRLDVPNTHYRGASTGRFGREEDTN